jgi:predicted nucleic acid-binding protein
VVDSNILVYACDLSDPQKQARAMALVEKQARDGTLVISTQVLNEFYYRATRPNRPPAISHQAAATIVTYIAEAARVLPLTAAVNLCAVDAVERHQLSFWDALI